MVFSMEFASAVNAVAAALELQQRMLTANVDEPDDRKIFLRIGINLGDVIEDGSDIYGEGVNVAARLEGLSEAGAVCVSGAVVAEANGKVRFTARDLGEVSLKNISRVIRAYQLTPLVQDRGSPDLEPIFADAIPLAVLPDITIERTNVGSSSSPSDDDTVRARACAADMREVPYPSTPARTPGNDDSSSSSRACRTSAGSCGTRANVCSSSCVASA